MYVCHIGPHRVQLDEGESGGCGRDDVVHHTPIPGHQFQRIGDSRQENQSHREESDHQQWGFRIGEETRGGQPEERGCHQVRHHHGGDVQSVPNVGDTEEVG